MRVNNIFRRQSAPPWPLLRAFIGDREIDLLFEDGEEIVAVEVKTRDVEDFVQPEETVRWSQLRRIGRALETYAQDNNFLERSWRIDVILIVIERDGSVLRLDHLRSVYPG